MTTDNIPPLPYEAFDHSHLTGEAWVALWHTYVEQHTAELRKQYRQLVTSLAEQQAYPDDWWQDELRRLESL